jgi:hypothetical protein
MTSFAALMTNIARVKTATFGAAAAATTPTNRADMPNAMAVTLFAASMRLPIHGERRPANSPTIRAMPSWPTLTSKPRAMTATKGGANR